MIHELMAGCPWAENRSKLERAIKEVRGDSDVTGEVGTNQVTEQAVKAVYIRLLGRVIEEKTDNNSQEASGALEVPGTPKRRGRKPRVEPEATE